ncbi:hypothetical protein [Algoriphagus mannitolivorans]|uniref:hypothetical protein n=1 Tax=Algoriphagus mannitolivorans TaxID=226504 RepID=UPI00040A47F2|nr:hypothetical protein [Algoriphagus mannitolivorans]
MNIDQEPELNTFFQELRKQDEQLLIPPFPKLEKKSRFLWWIPAGIAATILLGAFFLPREKEVEPAPEVLIITLVEGPDQELQFHIQETTEMDIWESPTASLLTDY